MEMWSAESVAKNEVILPLLFTETARKLQKRLKKGNFRIL
jgi:hypothetical protein